MTGTLFVHGQARSGTSALTRVLNAHPRIALGMERYQRLWSPERIGELRPGLFERERFFDFSDALTTNAPVGRAAAKWDTYYAELESRWDAVDWRGDKVLTLKLLRLWDNFPDARVVTIVRPIEEVAPSYAARAARPGSTGAAWGRDLDARRAVDMANRMLGKIRQAARARPDQVLVVEHARFFSRPDSLAAILDFLGLGRCPDLDAAWSAASTRYLDTLRDRPRPLAPDDQAYLDAHANRWLWRQVLDLAVG